MYKSESWKTALLTKDMSGLEPLGRDSSAGWDWPATAWWEPGNKPRPATAGASLVASWERPRFKLRLAATRAGCHQVLPGSSFNVSRGWSLLMPARECLGKTARWAKAGLHRAWACLGWTSARVSRLGRGGSLRNAMPGQTVLAKLLESDRSGPARWKESITMEQWHLPKFPSPERFTRHPCPSSPTLGLVN